MRRFSALNDKLMRKMVESGIPESVAALVSDDANRYPPSSRKFVAKAVMDDYNLSGAEVDIDTYIRNMWPDLRLIRNWLVMAKEQDGSDLNMHKYQTLPAMLDAANEWLRVENPRAEVGHPALYQDDDAAHTIMYFKDGWRWVQLTSRDCYNEGKSMQHCVWGRDYVDAVERDSKRLYSLRDPSGNPHITAEVLWNSGSDAYREAYQQAERLAAERGHDVRDRGLIESIVKTEFDTPAVHRFAQVYGKQNKPPVARFAPYLKDFLLANKEAYISDQLWNLATTPDDILDLLRQGAIDIELAMQKLEGTVQMGELLEIMRPTIVEKFMRGDGRILPRFAQSKGWEDPLIIDILAAVEAYQGDENLPVGSFAGAPRAILDRLGVALAPLAIRRILGNRTWDTINNYTRVYGARTNPLSETLHGMIAEAFAADQMSVESVLAQVDMLGYDGRQVRAILELSPAKVMEYIDTHGDRGIRVLDQTVGGDLAANAKQRFTDQISEGILNGRVPLGDALDKLLGAGVPMDEVMRIMEPVADALIQGFLTGQDNTLRRITGFRGGYISQLPWMQRVVPVTLDMLAEGSIDLPQAYAALTDERFPPDVMLQVLFSDPRTLQRAIMTRQMNLRVVRDIMDQVPGAWEAHGEVLEGAKEAIKNDIAAGLLEMEDFMPSFDDEDVADAAGRRISHLVNLSRQDPEAFAEAIASPVASFANEKAYALVAQNPEVPGARDLVAASTNDPALAKDLVWQLGYEDRTMYDYFPEHEATAMLFRLLSMGEEVSRSSRTKHAFYEDVLDQLPPQIRHSEELRPLMHYLMQKYPASKSLTGYTAAFAADPSHTPEQIAEEINSMYSPMRQQLPEDQQRDMLIREMTMLSRTDPERFYAVLPLLNAPAKKHLHDHWWRALDETNLRSYRGGLFEPQRDPEAELRMVDRVNEQLEPQRATQDQREQNRRRMTTPKQLKLPLDQRMASLADLFEDEGLYRIADRIGRMLR